MSLRTKLILIFLGLSVVPLAALSFLSYTNSIRSLRDLVERDNRVAATDLQRRVSLLNGEIRSRVEDVARLPELQDLAPGGLQEEGRAALLARAMQARVSDRWSYFSDLEFQPVAVARPGRAPIAAVARTPAVPGVSPPRRLLLSHRRRKRRPRPPIRRTQGGAPCAPATARTGA